MSNLSPKFTPRTYADAHDILTTRDYKPLTLCYETTLHRGTGDGPAIRHHTTDIVTWHADGSITLNGGGWASRTTSDRMHRFTPPNVRVNARKNTLAVTVDDVVIGDATYGLTIQP